MSFYYGFIYIHHTEFNINFIIDCYQSERCVLSGGVPELMQSQAGHVGFIFLHCENWFHLFDFSPLCIFKWRFKLPAWTDAKLLWLHWFDFSPLCVFKCIFKWPDWTDAKSHWLHLLDFSPLCVFKCCLKLSEQEDA